MELKDYLLEEDKYLEMFLAIGKVFGDSDSYIKIMKQVALEVNDKEDYIILTKDEESGATAGAEESNLMLEQRDVSNKKFVAQMIAEREDMDLIGYKSFLPLLVSEYTLDKHHIPYGG